MKVKQTDEKKRTGSLRNDIRLYVEKRLELLNLTLAEEVSMLITDGIERVIGVLLLSGALLFSWLAFAFLLSDWIGSLSGGFGLASLPLFVLTFIFLRKGSSILAEKIQSELIEKAIINFDEKIKNRPAINKEDE